MNAAITSSGELMEEWTVKPDRADLKWISPVKTEAKDTITLGQIDPEAEPYSPDYTATVAFPDWMTKYLGAPAYVSVNVYMILGGDASRVFFSKEQGENKPILDIDLSQLMRNALLSNVLMRYINSHIMYLRVVAAGLIIASPLSKAKIRCQVRTGLTTGEWPDYYVSYHTLLACGLDSMEVKADPDLQSLPMMEESIEVLPDPEEPSVLDVSDYVVLS